MENLKVNKSVIGPSKMTTGNAYRVRVVNKLNGMQFSFTFNDNYLNESTDEQMLQAVVFDYQTAEYCSNIDEFMAEYGYKTVAEAQPIYKAVLRNAQKVKRCLLPEQIEEISRLDD